jgi:riboflavin kinase/FMN adenylyltransferase
MRTLVGLDALGPSERGLALAIGTFDGVHVGHRALIAQAMDRAAGEGWESGVLTWDRHPAQTLRPDKAPPLLTTPERKAELIDSLGVDLLVVLPFDEAFSHITAEDFAGDILAKRLGIDAVFVGPGWRFGHGRAGDMDLLRRTGADLGYDAVEVDAVEVGGEVVSSSRTRKAVAAADLEAVRTLLGRAFDVDGEVMTGDGRGRQLGVPTANLAVVEGLATPPLGVYAGRARVDDVWYLAATNIGTNPTFGGDKVRIETYILDFDADIYGKTIRIEFHERLRDEKRFDNVADLVTQMHDDIDRTRELLA